MNSSTTVKSTEQCNKNRRTKVQGNIIRWRETAPYFGGTDMNNSAPVHSRTSETLIGKTKYVVTTHYNENGRETAEDNLLRCVTSRVSGELKKAENPA